MYTMCCGHASYITTITDTKLSTALVVPAAAYNAFIDAAVDYRRRTAQVAAPQHGLDDSCHLRRRPL